MHFLSVSSVILPLIAFVIGSHAAALKTDSLLANRHSRELGSKLGARQVATELVSNVQAGPVPSNLYSSLAVAAGGQQDYSIFGDSSYVNDGIQEAIAMALEGLGNPNLDLSSSTVTTTGSVSSSLDEVIFELTATVSLTITDMTIFQLWSDGIASVIPNPYATSAAVQLQSSMENSNQITFCFNIWVPDQGWCGVGGGVVDTIGQPSAADMEEIVAIC